MTIKQNICRHFCICQSAQKHACDSSERGCFPYIKFMSCNTMPYSENMKDKINMKDIKNVTSVKPFAICGIWACERQPFII